MTENLENWYDTGVECLMTCDLGTEPLSRSQIFEFSTVLEGLEISPNVPPPSITIAKPIKKNRDLSRILQCDDDCSPGITKDDLIKNDILLYTTPETVETFDVNGETFLIFKNHKGKQIFIQQKLMNQDQAQAKHTGKKHKIVNVCMFDICKMLEYQLPQFITNHGLKLYLCPLQCDKAYSHIADAKMHALKHMKIKPYKCEQPGCTWAFYTPNKLQRHKETHNKVKIFVCGYGDCKKAFSTVNNLHEHEKKHAVPARLECSVRDCMARFQNETQRKNHYKTHNRSEAPFKCTNRKCQRVFFDMNLQKAHLGSCKDSENTCRYPGCGKTFQTPFRLKEHIRVHTGSKPYQCSFENCNSRFTSSSKLSRHISSHIGDKKHICTVDGCNKSFLRSDHLKEHMLTHNRINIDDDTEIEELVTNDLIFHHDGINQPEFLDPEDFWID